MANKTTKRALLLSVLAVIFCLTLLVGTTYAWFTDSATSVGNKIVAGTLDVQLWMYDESSGTFTDISTSPDPIFGENSIAQNDESATLWEPGKTQVVYLSVKNGGNLDLKYRVALNVKNVTEDLNDVVRYAITPDAMPVDGSKVEAWTGGYTVSEGINSVSDEDIVLKAGEEHFFALSVHMDEEAGSEYMNGTIDFDIRVLATQLASEYDSFDNQYDKDATYPDVSNP